MLTGFVSGRIRFVGIRTGFTRNLPVRTVHGLSLDAYRPYRKTGRVLDMTTTPRGADAALRDRLTALVPGLDLTATPRRFLLVDYTDDSDTGSPEIAGWGLRVADSALVVHRDHTVSQFRPARRAFERLVDCHDELLWLDEPVDGGTVPSADGSSAEPEGKDGRAPDPD
ncbi:hypothetical protein NUM_13630 [Actinocatenispora comari]|uniref:Uncharacterized protein n=2 Tax=Actinocatenispora comari TaxID=2807577 RepID=A0A8J4ELZ6_9ACTN|nr:hypothetical protein NUM_13630 [Actinocatenispora comari]